MREWFGEHAQIVKWVAIAALLAFGALILLDWLNSKGKSQQAADTTSSDPAGTLTYTGPADVTITENQYVAPGSPGSQPPIIGQPIVAPGPGHVGLLGGPDTRPMSGQPGGHEGGPTPVPTPHPGVFPHPHPTHTAAAHPEHPAPRHRAPVHEHAAAPAHRNHLRHPGHGYAIPPGGHPFGGGSAWTTDIFYPTRD